VTRTAAAIALAGALCFAGQSRAAVARQGQVVMGTVLSVIVVAGDSTTAEAAASAAIDEARRWDDALTIWRPDGELASLNAHAGLGPFAVGPRLAKGLAEMLKLCAQTGGAFEPATGSLPITGQGSSRLRGIREVLALEGEFPSRTDARHATLDKGSILDPGAIGKGLAIDAMIAALQARGIESAFVDFGGSSQTGLGTAPGNTEGWTVLVSALSSGTAAGTVHLRDSSISTSRSAAKDTRPIFDPRSARPVPPQRLVTVRTADATSADAWSTAMVVRGRDGLADASRRGVAVLIEDGEGRVVSPEFGLIP